MAADTEQAATSLLDTNRGQESERGSSMIAWPGRGGNGPRRVCVPCVSNAAKLLCAPARRKPATPCMRHGFKFDLTERMVAMMKLTLGLLLALALSSRGSTPGQRAVSGGLIGAGVGAGAGALTAPHR
jgi:hypothetical protein